MLFTVDISNSHITLGVFQKNGTGFCDRPSFTARMVTDGSAPEISTPVN